MGYVTGSDLLQKVSLIYSTAHAAMIVVLFSCFHSSPYFIHKFILLDLMMHLTKCFSSYFAEETNCEDNNGKPGLG